MSHSDTIKDLPDSANLLASTDDVKNAAYKIKDKKIYALQFHLKYIILLMVKKY